jgi:hypothetical protein
MVSGSSRLGKQLEDVIATLDRVGARFALIGGLALAPHKVIRATQDIDLLIDADLGDAVDQALTSLGYRCLHRSADAAICAAINASISCMRTGERYSSGAPLQAGSEFGASLSTTRRTSITAPAPGCYRSLMC